MSNESNLTRRMEDKLKAQQAKQVPQPVVQKIPPSALIFTKNPVSTLLPNQIEPSVVKEQIAATAAPISEQKLEPKGVISGNNFIIHNMKNSDGAVYNENGEKVATLKRDDSGDLGWKHLSKFSKGTYIFKIIENSRNSDENNPHKVWTFYAIKNA
ncbi:MAG: hypothetical protein NTY68_01850 [Candidatus Micrarchaeota archaeon]|nr:hypothetical protein [Candidatus Micrarchaeota archaeon]